MPAVNLSPVFNAWQGFTVGGIPLAGGKLYSYLAGTSTPHNTYTTIAGNVANSNPIILQADGRPSFEIWLEDGIAYKFILTDSLGLNSYTYDNISGVNDDTDILALLAGSSGSSLIGFLQAGAGAVLRTQQSKDRDTVHISEFGGSAGASASTNTAALLAAMNAVGNGGEVHVGPSGNWALTAGTNFAAAGVSIVGEGKPVFDFSAGTGIGFKLDAGGSGAIIQRMRVENILFKGGPSITEVFYSRGIVRSIFRNLEAQEATTSGFALLFNVLNTFDHCFVSDDAGHVQTTKPTNYWLLTDDGNSQNHTQANTFLNCETSGIGLGATQVGWNLTNAILNVWIGGTSESLGYGIDIQNDQCRENTWIGFDLEDNRIYDVRVKGYNNSFYNCFAQSTLVTDNISISTGVNTLFSGGYYREVNLGAGSSDTAFHSLTFDDNASLGIQGTGSFKRYGCITNTGGVAGNKTGTLRDVLGPTSSATLSGSQNNTPAQTVTLAEAIVSGRMCYQRGKIAFTAAGTAANSIAITMDSSFPAKSTMVGLPAGTFVYTTAGGTRYQGACVFSTSTTLVFTVSGGTNNFGINPAVTIANGDNIVFSVEYPLE